MAKGKSFENQWIGATIRGTALACGGNFEEKRSVRRCNAGGSVRRVYRPDSVSRITGWQSFIWARHCWHARAIYPHARAGRPNGSEEPAHAYLMLLRVEVTAFHPAAS